MSWLQKPGSKPKYFIYAVVDAIVLISFILGNAVPHTMPDKIGWLSDGHRAHLHVYDVKATLVSSDPQTTHGSMEIRFDDTFQIPPDLLLAAQYSAHSLRDFSIAYSSCVAMGITSPLCRVR